MNSKFIKKGIVAAVLASAIVIPTGQVFASELGAMFGKTAQSQEVKMGKNALVTAVQEVNEKEADPTIRLVSSEEIRLNDLLSDVAFGVVGEEGYLLVRAEADMASDWIGKIYEDSAIRVIEKKDGWVEIESEYVMGYIPEDKLISGEAAAVKAMAILEETYSVEEIASLDKEVLEEAFSYGETRKSEEERLAKEEIRRKAEEKAKKEAEEARVRARGQAVVAYAKQFLGNPYVYGGTSLTSGTDCSGFVKGVFAHFGISMPRTSYAMRSVGRPVSYSEMLPGDVVCYAGHVGIYAGNGMIVNAIDESKGIGMSNATYAPIITIRRLY